MLVLFFRVVELIANKELIPIDNEIIETKCEHWEIKDWSKLDTRTIGPIMKVGGHDWYRKAERCG